MSGGTDGQDVLVSAKPTDGRKPTDLDVRYVAKLARLELSPEEEESFAAQLDTILGHVSTLKKLPTDDVAATAQVIEARNVERADELMECLPQATVLAMAPAVQGPFIRVPRIIAEE